jgi:cytoskeletal protein CcmA (bactofilin family)
MTSPDWSETLSAEPKGSADSDSVIGRGLRILGNVVADGTLQLDGVVEGDVRCMALKVGDSGQVMGGIIADEVTVDGRVGGDIKGQSVTLQSQARVTGDIHYVQLAIEQGALFEGRSCPSNRPTKSDEKGDGAANANASEREPDEQYWGSGDRLKSAGES